MATIQAARRGAFETSVITAWYGEYFARQKWLKGLPQYLEEDKPKEIVTPGHGMDAAPWLALMGN